MYNRVLNFFYWNIYKRNNYSQGNEEQILRSLFLNKKKGFYVDVGCHHPNRFSNTALLYKKGWRGINIDADPKNLNLFNFLRKRDFNVRALISNTVEHLDYYYFNDSAINGCLTNTRVEMLKQTYKVIKVERILTSRLDNILDNYKVDQNKIDLLDIDVEGYDFQVLQSIDLNRFDVKVILIEVGKKEEEIIEYLKNFNYQLYKREDRNSFFIKN
ncbi:FkbM family methyltransferase [Flavobacteriaceae bacterium]|nr:FkbM family methyltransferase [Flavobacteriaceae bacterium]